MNVSIRALENTPVQTYLSDSVQVADLLDAALDYTGPADITLTSFSISEEFLRRLFFIRKSGRIRNLRIVLDFKATNKTLMLWPFIAQTVEHCYLSNNHSKILLVGGDSRQLTAVMSQNLTRGNRHECGAIFTTKEIYNTMLDDVNHMIERKTVPFNEIYGKAID